METLTLIFLGQTAIPMRTGQTLLCKNLAKAFIPHEVAVAPDKDNPEREAGGGYLKPVEYKICLNLSVGGNKKRIQQQNK